MSLPEVITYADLVDHLVWNNFGSGQDREQRDIYVAIQNAFRNFVLSHNWRYYYTHGRVNLVAPHSTGTITYDQSTNVLTTTDTWPSWAADGRVEIADVVYPVLARTADTTVTLDTSHAPTANIAAGTAYTIFQSRYPLPTDFRKMDHPFNEDGSFITGYVPPTQWLDSERNNNYAGEPERWTIMSDPSEYGRLALVVDPYPSTAKTIDFIYQRVPRRLKISGYETAHSAGTVNDAADPNQILLTGTGTSWTTSMAGSLVLIGDSTNVPTGLAGAYPYVEYRKIATVNSSTSITMDSVLDTELGASTKYRITDPVDIWHGGIDALLRGCEYQLAIARDKNVKNAKQLYDLALLEARENDSMVLETQRAGYGASNRMKNYTTYTDM